jgi:hypothetical protein
VTDSFAVQFLSKIAGITLGLRDLTKGSVAGTDVPEARIKALSRFY